ncbi:MAG: GntR family transcriptional regulator [Actinomycetes bacterium]
MPPPEPQPDALADKQADAQPDRSARSQTVSALLALRQMVFDGRLSAGDRLVETSLVRLLGVSRTPVRAALSTLEHEGLLRSQPGGGYTVASFDLGDVFDAVEVRGTLEGMAARLAAEHGVTRRQREGMQRCLDRLDAVVTRLGPDEAVFRDYVTLNEEFHSSVVEAADNAALSSALGRVVALPFASPSAFVLVQAQLPESLTVLVSAQEQHRGIFEAICAGEGARAESLAREHALIARRNLDHVLRRQQALRALPGFRLIHDRSVTDEVGGTE